MKSYHLKDVIHLKEGNGLPVKNEALETIGTIERADIPGCERSHMFSFRCNDGSEVQMGIKKRSVKSLLAATYVIRADGSTYTLKDKPGNSLLYFCVRGEIEGSKIIADENWSKEVEIKVDGEQVAMIRPSTLSLKTRFDFEDYIEEISILFGMIVLLYFMYKIYRKETAFIDGIFLD